MLEYDEKRSFPRISVDCPAKVKTEQGAEFDAILRDLSGGGALIVLDQDVAAGSALSLTVVPHSAVTPPLSAQLRVIRCTKLSDSSQYEVSCEIEKIVA